MKKTLHNVFWQSRAALRHDISRQMIETVSKQVDRLVSIGIQYPSEHPCLHPHDLIWCSVRHLMAANNE